MKNSEIRREARECLRGRWGKAIGMILLYTLITGAISSVIGAFGLIITVPMAFGFAGQMLKFTRKEEVGICDYFSIGFDNFGKAWSIFGYTLLKILVPFIAYAVVIIGFLVGMAVAGSTGGSEIFIAVSLVCIIAFIAVYIWLFSVILLYEYTDYVGNNKPELTGKEVVEESARLMRGNRWKFIGFSLSFIGWMFLSMLTFGIGFIWLIPYMEVASVKFFESLIGNTDTSVVEDNPIQ